MAAVAQRLARSQNGESFLRALADPARMPLAAEPLAIVVAHPDDETLGCGAQLRRLAGAKLIFVTNGAPHDPEEATRHGFSGPEAYAAARSRELAAALALAHVPERNIIKLGLFDQTAALQLADLSRTIHCLITAHDLRLVLTHAYEGGHPDHDATAFAVCAAAEVARRSGRDVAVLEMPLYRANGDRVAYQRFAPGPEAASCTIRLTSEERKLKRRMLDAHASQRATLAPFGVDAERFRVAPDYDFTRLPNQGQVLYERYPSGMTAAHWLALTRAALDELRLGETRSDLPS